MYIAFVTNGDQIMKTESGYQGGENFDLRDVLLKGRTLQLSDRTAFFQEFLQGLRQREENLCMRCIGSPADREVTIVDLSSGQQQTMLMFGSNNYLGLATHPHVTSRAAKALSEFGAGVGGPPLLNGYTTLHRQLEERLADLKGTEDAMIFSSGYGANVGLVSGLTGKADIIVYDAYSHASFCDGMTMSGAQSFLFSHNDLSHLDMMLARASARPHSDIFVGVEGVYSMDGDIAPLDRILPLCRRYGAYLIVDDAHGTGVMGSHGRGTAEHFGLEGEIPATMGTFSKALTATGGFVAASKDIIDYLRFFARSYMFSASLPPATVATVLAGLDVLEQEPERLATLRENINYAASGLRKRGFSIPSQSAILPLRVPEWMDIRKAARAFHERGVFINSVEYPAVPVSQQRFRISLMATHTREDIDHLMTAVEEVWSLFGHDLKEHADEPRQRNAA
jgi:glycine C-acetyltransferase